MKILLNALACAWVTWATMAGPDNDGGTPMSQKFLLPQGQSARMVEMFLLHTSRERGMKRVAYAAIESGYPGHGEWAHVKGKLGKLIVEAEELNHDPRIVCQQAEHIYEDNFPLHSNLRAALHAAKGVAAIRLVIQNDPSIAPKGKKGKKNLKSENREAVRYLQKTINDLKESECLSTPEGRRLQDTNPDSQWFAGMPTAVTMNESDVFQNIQMIVDCNISTFQPMLDEWKEKRHVFRTYCLWNDESCAADYFATKMLYWKGTACLVLLPFTEEELALAYQLQLKYGLPFSIRGGNHDNLAMSTKINGVVIATEFVDGVKVDPVTKTAVVSAGANLLELYHDLWEQGKFMVPGGTCPGVGNVGLASAGGYGMSTQMFGLTVDNVKQFSVVTPTTREVVKANNESYDDLFWACRGGRCASAGLITQTVFTVHPIDVVTSVTIEIPMTYAVEMTEYFLQQILTIRPKWTVAVRWGNGGVYITGQWIGPKSEYLSEIDPIVMPENLRQYVTLNETEEFSYLQSVGYWGYGCSQTQIVSQTGYKTCLLNAASSFSTGQTVTGYLYKPLTTDQLQRMLDVFNNDKEYVVSSTAATNYRFFPYNGIVQTVKDTSFTHREMLMEVQLMVYDSNFISEEIMDRWDTWMQFSRNILYEGVDYENQRTYPNFPLLVPDWPQQYWGEEAYARLQDVKLKYDPDNTLSNPQSTLPAQPNNTLVSEDFIDFVSATDPDLAVQLFAAVGYYNSNKSDIGVLPADLDSN